MTEIILGTIIAFQMAMIIWDRRETHKREKQLIAALLSRNAAEYASATNKIDTTPKQAIKKMEKENNLALAAQKYLDGDGVPVR